MEYFQVLLPLAIILVISKIFGKICVRIGIPQVIGLIAAGILVSVVEYIPGPMQDFFASGSPALTGLGFFAKIGVVLIMFNAGLDINVKQIKSVGLPATIITLAGVFVPMILGFIAACLIRNGTMIGLTHDQYFTNLFYGVIMTATSVSVTVATLQELGKLTSKVGTTVVTAAILDDIVGIIVLSVVIGMSGKEGGEAENPWIVLLKTVLFFIAAVLVGWLARKIFAAVERNFPHHRLLPVMSVALCVRGGKSFRGCGYNGSVRRGYGTFVEPRGKLYRTPLRNYGIYDVYPRILRKHRYRKQIQPPRYEYAHLRACFRCCGAARQGYRLRRHRSSLQV